MLKPWRPSPRHKLLVEACLADDADLGNAVSEWEGRQPWPEIDGGSLGLLPYLYRRLLGAGIQIPLMPKLKGVYARAWLEQVRNVQPALEEVQALAGAGFHPLLLKGSALQALVYSASPATRPTTDVDILLPLEEATEAVRWLQPRSYLLPTYRQPDDRYAESKAVALQRGDSSIDVHWRLHDYGLDPSLEGRLARRSQQIQLEGVTFDTLSIPDHLLHAILHGSGYNVVPGFRWILDAHLLAERMTGSDWDVVVAEVRSGGYRTPVLEMLTFLRDDFASPVPDGVLETIQDQPRSLSGLLGYGHLALPSATARRLTRVAYGQYLADTGMHQGHPWRHFIPDAPRVSWGVWKEYWRRRRSVSSTLVRADHRGTDFGSAHVEG